MFSLLSLSLKRFQSSLFNCVEESCFKESIYYPQIISSLISGNTSTELNNKDENIRVCVFSISNILYVYPDEFDRSFTSNIAKEIGSPGPINLQCRLKNGIGYVFEINSRFSTTNSIRTACGYNEVELLVHHFLTGEKKYITKYKKLTAMAYINYVFIEPEMLNRFEKKYPLNSTD